MAPGWWTHATVRAFTLVLLICASGLYRNPSYERWYIGQLLGSSAPSLDAPIACAAATDGSRSIAPSSTRVSIRHRDVFVRMVSLLPRTTGGALSDPTYRARGAQVSAPALY